MQINYKKVLLFFIESPMPTPEQTALAENLMHTLKCKVVFRNGKATHTSHTPEKADYVYGYEIAAREKNGVIEPAHSTIPAAYAGFRRVDENGNVTHEPETSVAAVEIAPTNAIEEGMGAPGSAPPATPPGWGQS